MTFVQGDPRRHRGQAVQPDPSTIFTPAELARLEHVREVRELARHWLLDYPEVKRRLFVKFLHRADPADRRAPDDFELWMRGRRP